jgi:hypothetical protein
LTALLNLGAKKLILYAFGTHPSISPWKNRHTLSPMISNSIPMRQPAVLRANASDPSGEGQGP